MRAKELSVIVKNALLTTQNTNRFAKKFSTKQLQHTPSQLGAEKVKFVFVLGIFKTSTYLSFLQSKL
jgi:hypothetical protein